MLMNDHWKPYYTYGCTHALCNARPRICTRCYWNCAMRLGRPVVLSNRIRPGAGAGANYSVTATANARHPCRMEQHLAGDGSNAASHAICWSGFAIMRTMCCVSWNTLSNNQGEQNLRMTKVQQKISGYLRSVVGLKRSAVYARTCSLFRKTKLSRQRH